MTRQLFSYPHGIGADLLDPEPIVLAIVAEFEVQHFSDDKVAWRGTDATGKQRRAERTSPIRER